VKRRYRGSMSLSDDDYARLLALRTGLRHFLHWSEQQARSAGLTPAQHQLLLAIRGQRDPRGPTVGEIADSLLLRHHSTVELIDRADAAGLVMRSRDPDDHRIVRLHLTEVGAERLEALSALHLEELERLALRLPAAWKGLAPTPGGHRNRPKEIRPRAGSPRVEIARVYGFPLSRKSSAVLVDRLWPRGLPRERAPFSIWMKEVAPSAELRVWYGHKPERFSEFTRRYRRELTRGPTKGAREQLRQRADDRGVTLLTATKDLDRSGAAVLRDVLVGGS
jgi:uncharacterized protein YeaO (DUF488 family)/DNA-binding MarR family transcriptional regulator